MSKNHAHLDNFRIATKVRFAIVDRVRSGLFESANDFEISSGKTVEQAVENFYVRYAARCHNAHERELFEAPQHAGRLCLVKIDGPSTTTIERGLMLLVFAETAQ